MECLTSITAKEQADFDEMRDAKRCRKRRRQKIEMLNVVESASNKRDAERSEASGRSPDGFKQKEKTARQGYNRYPVLFLIFKVLKRLDLFVQLGGMNFCADWFILSHTLLPCIFFGGYIKEQRNSSPWRHFPLQKNPPALALCPATNKCISTSENISDLVHYVPPWNYNPKEGRGSKKPVSKEVAMEELLEVFVDDVEFWFPPGKKPLVQYRSASRIGFGFDANRKRVKAFSVDFLFDLELHEDVQVIATEELPQRGQQMQVM
ncbi:hypothetical protein L1987_56867 [Smallanthus sonchifolius]|uniref:Uncharacterized protein n=1 Tax=Smallanthus sonchifolius TaxID=185202 RepID=A0ACB9DBG6_9ASTR|nr:hypothetical protein L1987_56867 [Smallanthus sonchifolius]